MADAILEDVEERVRRESELAAVDQFTAADAAVPAALVIEGEAGIGKTTIVRAALARASSVGLRVLLARPAAGEAELPYVGLGDLLGGFGTDASPSLARPQREAIEAALTRGRTEPDRAARAGARAPGVPPRRGGSGRSPDRRRRCPVARSADRLGALVCTPAAGTGAGARAASPCGRTAAAQVSRSRFPTGAFGGSWWGRCPRLSSGCSSASVSAGSCHVRG